MLVVTGFYIFTALQSNLSKIKENIFRIILEIVCHSNMKKYWLTLKLKVAIVIGVKITDLSSHSR